MASNKVLKWRHSPIDKEAFRALTHKSDLKALRHLLSHLSLAVVLGIVSYVGFLRLPVYFSIPIFFVYTNVFIFLGLASGIHEMSHGTVFESKRLQWFFIRFISFITFSDYVFYRASHTKHHQYTAHHGLEMEVVLPMKLRIRDFLYALLGNPYYTWRTYYNMGRRALGIIKGEWEEQIFPEDEPKKRQELIGWNRVLIIGHSLLFVIFILTGQWPLIFIVTFPMGFSSILSYLVTMTQHTGLQADVADSRKCCRSVNLNPFYAFLYWNMNYHIEHHMYAAVPFYNLKKLSHALQEDMPERKGLIGSYMEIIRIQKRQKIEPTYYLDVQCPE